METYGVCLDEATEGRYEATFVASLTEQLPRGCRWRCAYDPDMWWDDDRLLMAALVNNLRGLIWGLADKSKRGPEPEQIGPAWAKGRRSVGVAMGVEELMAELRKPRRKG